MTTFKCVGYKGHPCGKEVDRRSQGHKRCLDCAKEAHKLAAIKYEKSPKAAVYRLKHYALRNRERRIWGKLHPEEISVRNHHNWISNSKNPRNKNYKGMPFFDLWNPRVGGSFKIGAEWIIKNIGKRPKNTSLHIVEQIKGFVPGNLEWTSPKKQVHRQVCKIIAQQQNQIKKLKERIMELEGGR